MVCIMTDKQTKVILLFAQNYSITNIAKTLDISIATAKKKLKAIEKNYPKEFDNAVSMRESCKRLTYGLQHVISLQDAPLNSLGALESYIDISI